MDPTFWQSGLGEALPDFDQQFGNAQGQEDWEDWLRWEPTAEAPTSENGASGSGSSKNDSPVQNTVWPLGYDDFVFKGTDGIAQPAIVGEDGFNFGLQQVIGTEPFMFGAPNDAANNLSYDSAFDANPQPTNVPKAQPKSPPWPLPSNADPAPLSVPTTNGDDAMRSEPMPATTTTPSFHESPESSNRRSSGGSQSTPPSQPPKKKGGRKRKVQPEPESQDDNEGSGMDGDEPPFKKTSHNVIEKRYRNNLNDKIVELKNSVPSLRAMNKANKGERNEDLEGLTAAHKHNKATIMAKATEYIKHLETRNKSLAEELAQMKARLNAVEAAMGSHRARQTSLSSSPGMMHSSRPRQASSSTQANSPSFLNVPQEQYLQTQGSPTYARPPNPPVDAQNNVPPQRNGGGLVNKLMLGTMAGLMAMEGFNEQQSGDGSPSGLAAFPLGNLLRRGTSDSSISMDKVPRQAAIPLLKICLVVGALIYLIAPLFSSSRRRKERIRSGVRLSQVPSLASPVEVRRKAWLTALQSVWVPKHFLLEVVAVTAKMIKLSVRRIMGAETFNALTGTSQEDEIARIKAWDIAVDAQLAGGDAEVSYYRLLLTLMASGTLPDSPIRLMQKAVHFRVFFWEVANAGYGNLIMFKQFTEKVGRIYWDSARKMQKELVHARQQGRPAQDDDVELLPDHLARLLELNCDDVLTDEMIQRAWNLAWNKPSAYRTVTNSARDSVVEDHAIRSPLDAIAAWYANMTVDDTLADAMNTKTSSLDTEYYIGEAVSMAPPASGTQIRALAAKAILSSTNRNKNIVAVLEALPVSSPTAGMTVTHQTPTSPDIHIALTLAKLLSLLASSSPATVRNRAFDMLGSLRLPPTTLTLLTAAASFRLLQFVSQEKQLTRLAEFGAEDIASSLRIWVGTTAGRNAGLSCEERGRLVDECLAVTKKVGGWEVERDSGYGSSESSAISEHLDPATELCSEEPIRCQSGPRLLSKHEALDNWRQSIASGEPYPLSPPESTLDYLSDYQTDQTVDLSEMWTQPTAADNAWPQRSLPEEQNFAHDTIPQRQPSGFGPTEHSLNLVDRFAWHDVQSSVDSGSPVLSHESQSTQTLQSFSEPDFLLPNALDLHFTPESQWYSGPPCVSQIAYTSAPGNCFIASPTQEPVDLSLDSSSFQCAAPAFRQSTHKAIFPAQGGQTAFYRSPVPSQVAPKRPLLPRTNGRATMAPQAAPSSSQGTGRPQMTGQGSMQRTPTSVSTASGRNSQSHGMPEVSKTQTQAQTQTQRTLSASQGSTQIVAATCVPDSAFQPRSIPPVNQYADPFYDDFSAFIQYDQEEPNNANEPASCSTYQTGPGLTISADTSADQHAHTATADTTQQTIPAAPQAAPMTKAMSSEGDEGRYRNHPLYAQGPAKDGLYYCPFKDTATDPSCNHKATKLKCNYDKYIDSHLKPFRCKFETCAKQEFSSTACLLRHEREAHGMHGHGERPHLCWYTGCERGMSGNGFPRRYNLFDHMKRVHDHKETPSTSGDAGDKKTIGRKRKASNPPAAAAEPPSQKSKLMQMPPQPLPAQQMPTQQHQHQHQPQPRPQQPLPQQQHRHHLQQQAHSQEAPPGYIPVQEVQSHAPQQAPQQQPYNHANWTNRKDAIARHVEMLSQETISESAIQSMSQELRRLSQEANSA
ncbi:hypothetical protein K431DRAFT_299645 [Polychaeton citri CBS 116435]|uniref:BHLH domain-containing protein n=1 Tax=Polychaeton citri CBS 116435 TaxID=1314669 RepID=A0A9P4UUM6_9PEZI|nr:hypothetical protein K431DRAFT_299645 [Polychaeton citri CBS 116435]